MVFAHLIFRHRLVQCSDLKMLQKGGRPDAREENIRNWKKLDDLGEKRNNTARGRNNARRIVTRGVGGGCAPPRTGLY